MPMTAAPRLSITNIWLATLNVWLKTMQCLTMLPPIFALLIISYYKFNYFFLEWNQRQQLHGGKLPLLFLLILLLFIVINLIKIYLEAVALLGIKQITGKAFLNHTANYRIAKNKFFNLCYAKCLAITIYIFSLSCWLLPTIVFRLFNYNESFITLLVTLGFGTGILLWLLIVFSMVQPLILFRSLPATAAMKMSFQLMHRHWWRSFTILALPALLFYIPFSLLTMLLFHGSSIQLLAGFLMFGLTVVFYPFHWLNIMLLYDQLSMINQTAEIKQTSEATTIVS